MTPEESHPQPESDAALAAERRARAALVERLFRQHNEALVRFLRTRVGSSQEAHEVAQEAYVRLLSLDEPSAVSYLRAFLFKTAANIAVDRHRRQVVHSRVTEVPQQLSDARTPERRVAGEQTVERLQRVIAALPAKCRRAFVLNQFHGMDFAAIAHDMRISERMVRKYVVRALLHCRTALDWDGEAE
ncbi:MAG: sigma-70 family RNA polymerase sigma factor [Gammaproteobacteria bacterium]